MTGYKIAVYGCERTLGQGVDKTEAWPAMLAKMLGPKVELSNFGVIGSGPDFQAMSMYQTIPVINPNLVVVLWGNVRNFAFYGQDFKLDLMTPHQNRTDTDYSFCRDLLDRDNGFYRFVSSFHLAFETCKIADVPMLWQMAVDPCESLEQFVDCSGLLKETLLTIDIGSVNALPGPRSHERFARSILERIKQENI